MVRLVAASRNRKREASRRRDAKFELTSAPSTTFAARALVRLSNSEERRGWPRTPPTSSDVLMSSGVARPELPGTRRVSIGSAQISEPA